MKRRKYPLSTFGGVLLIVLVVLSGVECFASECKTTDNMVKFDPNKFIHFVQITDVHIEDSASLNNVKQREEAQKRYSDYITLTQYILPNIIKPHVITVTGDLTHAVALNFPKGSKDWIDSKINIYVPGQCQEQWLIYSNITNVANEKLVKSIEKERNSSINLVYPFEEELENQRIFDLPGNHDGFGVSNKFDESKWLYLKYSQSSRFFKHGQTYVFDLKTNLGTFRYIMFDTTPPIGSYRPVNFFSSIQISELRKLEDFLTRNSEGISQTLAFGHYPSSMIPIMESDGHVSSYMMKDFFKRFNIISYFSGHLHKDFFEMTKLISSSGHIEVQSPDFKKERSFKLITLDNNRIGFKDFTVGELEKIPGVLISHPKDCRFVTDREPTVIKSGFIRLFIVYPHRVEIDNLSVRVLLDGIILDENLIISKDRTEYRINFDFNTLLNDTIHKISVEFDGNVITEHLFTKNDSLCQQNHISFVNRVKSLISWCILSLDWRRIFRTVTHYSCIGSILIMIGAKSLGFLQRVTIYETISLILQSISMRYGIWFLGVLTEDNRYGGLINLTYFYFNPTPLNAMEPIHKLEPFFTALSDHFKKVTIIDDSSLFFTLVGPTFVFSHLAIIIGYLMLECLDRWEVRYHKRYFKSRIFISIIVFMSQMIGFMNYYRKYVRSYGKLVLFTSFNNVIFPFFNIVALILRTYKDCNKQKVE